MLIRGAGHGLDATVKSGCVEVEGVVVIHFGILFLLPSVETNVLRSFRLLAVGQKESCYHTCIYIYIYIFICAS